MGQMAISDVSYDNYFQSHALGSNVKSNSIFNSPLVFVGLGPTGLLDSDSARSPTSPLDVAFLSNIGNPFRAPRSPPHEGQQRIWDCNKVGLSIVDSLEDCSKFSGKILRSSESKKPCPSPQMMINTPNSKTYIDFVEAPKSLPKDFSKLPCTKDNCSFQKGESTALFEIGDTLRENESFGKSRSCSLNSCNSIKGLCGLTGSNADLDSENLALNQLSSPPNFIGGSHNSNSLLPTELNSNPVSNSSCSDLVKSLSASEIELSEDYTCVIFHGPNPKTTHIFCDCVLGSHSNDVKNRCQNEEEEEVVVANTNILGTPNQYPSSDFLSVCNHCNKKLEEGKDIYIYRGEKAFCSSTCRALEIMVDEELEEPIPASENPPELELCGEHFGAGIPTAA